MDKETLSNYGWVVCAIVILAIMISLATPFGTTIKNRVADVVTSFRDNTNDVLDNMGGTSNFVDLGGDGSGGAGGTNGGEAAHDCVDSDSNCHCDVCGNELTHRYSSRPYCDVCGAPHPDYADHVCEDNGYGYCNECGNRLY